MNAISRVIAKALRNASRERSHDPADLPRYSAIRKHIMGRERARTNDRNGKGLLNGCLRCWSDHDS